MHAVCIDSSVKNAMICTNSNITEKWYGIAKPTLRQILWDSRQKKENSALTHSSVLTSRANIRQIVTTVCYRSIDSTRNGTTRRCKSFEKSEPTQFAHLWVGVNNDFKIP